MKSRTPTMARLAGGSAVGVGLAAAVVLGSALGLAPARLDPPDDPLDPPQAAALQPGPERVIVYCRDGRRIEARFLRQSPAEVIVEIAGIETAFPMADVLRVDPVPPVEEHYRQLRAVIADDDAEQLLLLVDWLRDREAYSLALRELAHVLEMDPGNADARTLKTQIEGIVSLLADRGAGETPEPGDRPDRSPRPAFPVLTPDQINTLKVYEVDLADPPRMSIDRETIRDLIEAYDGHELIPQSREGRAALERRSPPQLLELMFRLKAREFYGKVRVDGEPGAFRRFREDVHRAWLVNACATNACHGGQQSGRLWLDNLSPNAERTIYTNFLILERFRLADGTPLIDYDEPAKSPLLQMGLPRPDSLYPHPLVATSRTAVWRPVIGSADDVRFAEAVAWINAMYRPRPEYPVTYDPPQPAQGVPELPSDPIGER